jgi:hypothetical protein
MSLLPQRKKSPEELAKLRETLGIPGAAAETPPPAKPAVPAPAPHVETIVPAIHQAAVVEDGDPLPLQTEPAAPAGGPKPVHSFKRSERMPAASAAPSPTAASSRSARPVRSLRKSEQLPLATPLPESPPDSALPHVRHSDREIEEIRRREVLSMMNAVPNPRLFPAHPAIILPGYVLPPAAAAGIWFYQLPIAATAACALVSLVISGLILWRKPISRHHAAFIAVLSLFLLVFSALYYFPQLRHAT